MHQMNPFLPSIRLSLSCDNCLEDKSEDIVLCTTIVLSYMHTHMNSSYR